MTPVAPVTPFPVSGGECAAILRDIAWHDHPLGDPAAWPVELKTAIRICLTSKFATMVHWGPHLVTFYNDAYAAQLGRKHPGHLGQPAFEWWSEMWDQLDPFFQRVLAGESYFTENARYTPDRDGVAREAFFTHSHSPIWDDAGDVRGIYLTVVETTAQLAAEARSQLLTKELAHRIKNMMAVVQSIVNQSMRQAADLPAAQQAIAGRLLAYSRALDVLTSKTGSSAPLRQIVREVTQMQSSVASRITITGPEIELQSKAALAFSMVLHELSVNATKYGALSNDEGSIAIGWTVENDVITAVWHEAGGPPVRAPENTGFGSRLMRGLAVDLGGTPVAQFHPDGLIWTLRADLRVISAEPALDAGALTAS